MASYLAGYGAPAQPYNLPVDFGYPQNMTLAGIGGQQQVTRRSCSYYSS